MFRTAIETYIAYFTSDKLNPSNVAVMSHLQPARCSPLHLMTSTLHDLHLDEIGLVERLNDKSQSFSRGEGHGGGAPTKLVGDLQRAFQPHRLVGLSF